MPPTNSYVTVTDQFCGAGGSSLGAVAAGAELRLALNHWTLAIETHNTNFPDAAHDCTDISACDPRRYPSTDVLLTSPECTNHSLAKGKARKMASQLELFGTCQLDPSEERSRATMWDVVRFAEHHRYRIVIVENVVEARWWAPYPAWLQAMELLGYKHKAVYFNSMFAHPTPQSRDRMYVVFWQKSLRTPDLEIRPRAHCPKCGKDVGSVQSWKNPAKPWGKYGQQYVYRCPECASEVTPYYFCAANAIDWSLSAPRIGDRARPLKEKTLKRIEIGLKKFGRQPVLIDYVHTSRGSGTEMTWTVDKPHRTQLGIHTHALVTPPFTIETQWSHAEGDRSAGIDQPMPTQTAQQGRGLVVPPFLVDMTRTRGLGVPVDAAYPTQTGSEVFGLAVPPYLVDLRGQNAPREATDPLSTVCGSGKHHGVVVPFLSSYYGTGDGSPITDPVPTVPTRDRHALVLAPFLMSYYTRLSGQQAAVSGMDEAVPTVPGRAVHYLAQPGETPAVEDCGFRMLQPHEIKAAMGFPSDYKVLGNQREQVKQLGNAVTPPVEAILFQRCVAVLR